MANKSRFDSMADIEGGGDNAEHTSNMPDSISCDTATSAGKGAAAAAATSAQSKRLRGLGMVLTGMIVAVGIGASTAFLIVGITSANADNRQRFERKAADVVSQIAKTFEEYEIAALWVQQECRYVGIGSLSVKWRFIACAVVP